MEKSLPRITKFIGGGVAGKVSVGISRGVDVMVVENRGTSYVESLGHISDKYWTD
jgi:hypothetical protein